MTTGRINQITVTTSFPFFQSPNRSTQSLRESCQGKGRRRRGEKGTQAPKDSCVRLIITVVRVACLDNHPFEWYPKTSYHFFPTSLAIPRTSCTVISTYPFKQKGMTAASHSSEKHLASQLST